MPRALVGTFGAIARLGVLGVLSDGSVECVAEELAEADLLTRLEASDPDVIVLNGDDGSSSSLVAEVRDRRPEVTVIVCSNNQLTMRVEPGGAGGHPYETRLGAEELVGAVRAASAR